MAQSDFHEDLQLDEAHGAESPGGPKRKSPSRKTVVYTGFGGFLLFVLAFAIFFYFSFTTIEVQGNSMTPILKPGQRLLVSRAYWLVGKIKVGDIVVINNRQEKDVIIKRVYKTEGETVDFHLAPNSWDLTKGPYVVPKGKIYVLGDNYAVSQDSRDYGPFDPKDVVGKVVVVRSAIGPP